MKTRFLLLLATFVFFSLPALAQRNAPPGTGSPEAQMFSPALKLEFTVTEGERVLATGTIQGDFDNSLNFDGTTRLSFSGPGQWSVEAGIGLAYEKTEHSGGRPAAIKVDVYDLMQLQPPSGQSNTILPVRIFSTHLHYRGSGSYLLFSDGERKVTVAVVQK